MRRLLAASVFSTTLMLMSGTALAQANLPFPQEGTWTCREESVISGNQALVISEVSYPTPGKFISSGEAIVNLSGEREIRIALSGTGEFTVDGGTLSSTYSEIQARPLSATGFSESERDFLNDWNAYLVRGFSSIEGRTLEQRYVPHSASRFDLIAQIGGEDRTVSCERSEDLIG